METRLTHLDQYKMLREEIMYKMRELTQWEFAAAIAGGATFAWLLLHKNKVPCPARWWIVPGIVFFCAAKCLELSIRIRIIATYLQRIEEHAFGSNAGLPGWERYNAQRNVRWYDRAMVFLSAIVWVLVIALLIAISRQLCK